MFVLVSIILGLLILGTLLSLIFPIGGTWERMSPENQSIWDRERVVFKQWGPFITGTQTLTGGHQKFTGFAIGPNIWLKRRDYGVSVLKQQGFPEAIAKVVQGRVLLHLHLKLSRDRLLLQGFATPMKVEFYEDDTGIKSIQSVEPIPRTYRKAEFTPVKTATLSTVGKPAFDT